MASSSAAGAASSDLKIEANESKKDGSDAADGSTSAASLSLFAAFAFAFDHVDALRKKPKRPPDETRRCRAPASVPAVLVAAADDDVWPKNAGLVVTSSWTACGANKRLLVLRSTPGGADADEDDDAEDDAEEAAAAAAAEALLLL